MDSGTSEKKQHSRLGIVSCVAILLVFVLDMDIDDGAFIGLLIISWITGIISLRDKSKNRLFGYIGIVVNLFILFLIIYGWNRVIID
jgi:hypothetical protein